MRRIISFRHASETILSENGDFFATKREKTIHPGPAPFRVLARSSTLVGFANARFAPFFLEPIVNVRN